MLTWNKCEVFYTSVEYLYWVLKNHAGCTLPEEAFWCIRYHSFYPLHKDNEYHDLLNDADGDAEKLAMIKKFR